MCVHHGRTEAGASDMSAMHHRGGDATRADGGDTGSTGDQRPCHDQGATAACAAMVACSSVSALPTALADTGVRRGSMAVLGPSRAAPRLPGTAPDTPPPKA